MQYTLDFPAKVIATYPISSIDYKDLIKPSFDINNFSNYDFVPVFNDSIYIGVITKRDNSYESFKEECIELNTDLLINSNCSFKEIIVLLGKKGYVILKDEFNNYSIVTASDLLKQPFRVYLFNLISNFEVLLTDQIRNMLGKFDVVVDRELLDKPQIKRISKQYKIDFHNNQYIDEFECMYLSDKTKIMEKLFLKSTFISSFDSIQEYKEFSTILNSARNNVTHSKNILQKYTFKDLEYLITKITDITDDDSESN